MIRLIASDIDGTLLPAETQRLSPQCFAAVEALLARGILFCAASGRQYSNLHRLVAPVADRIAYCCENGAVVYYRGRVLAKTPLPRPECAQLVGQILAEPGCEVLISGADTSYLLPKQEYFLHHMRDEIGNNTRVITSLEDIPEEILKISAYTPRPAEEYAARFAPVWDRHLNVAVAGRRWLDFTLAHKGTALAELTVALGISARETAVFGDNFNDLPMFRFAGASYAMEHADPAVKAVAAHTCRDALSVWPQL